MTSQQRALTAGLAIIAASAVHSSALRSQSITRGSIEGIVIDGAGSPLYGARITATDRATGIAHSVRPERDNRFHLLLLPAGDYDVFVERIGYRPERIEGVPVRPGRAVTLEVILDPVSLPANAVDTVRFNAAAAVAGSRAGIGQRLPRFALNALPLERRALPELTRLTSLSGPGIAIEGLPSWMSTIYVDGVPYAGAAGMLRDAAGTFTGGLPLGQFRAAAVLTNPVDVEWSGFAGGALAGFTRRGTRTLDTSGFVSWGDAVFASSLYYDPQSFPHTRFEGGFITSGPIIQDSAHYVLGFEAERIETPLLQMRAGSGRLPQLRAIARDSFGLELDMLAGAPRVLRSEALSAFGRFDWRLAPSHALRIRANILSLPHADIGLTSDPFSDVRVVTEGSGISGTAALASTFGDRWASELRVSLATGRRQYQRAGADAESPRPATVFTRTGLFLGAGTNVPASFQRSSARVSETVHLRLPEHQFKMGFAAGIRSYDMEFGHYRPGRFFFSDAEAFAQSSGMYVGATGPAPLARFTFPHWALYVQDTWAAASGLELTIGLRYGGARLPKSDIALATDWLELTGLANSAFDVSVTKISPRLGFTWLVGGRREWIVRGAMGVYYGRVDPLLTAELLTYDGAIEVYRALGTFDGRWPTPPQPDSGVIAVQNPTLTLLDPEYEPPRSARVSVGLTRSLGDHAALHLSATYRETRALPRRRDLNLARQPAWRDAHGRPVYGNLAQHGYLLTAEPASNRRFTDFDRVYAIEADGRSTYWGATVALEHSGPGPLRLLARYTYSQTRDDWLGARTATPAAQLPAFPDEPAGRDWAWGISDFDVPHRLTLGAELNLELLGMDFRMAGLYRYHSGLPFTPGFPRGVDVNGDGSLVNDPAFVDASVAGMDRILADSDCLASQIGGFAERNSCRGPDVHALDLRFGVGLFSGADYSVELMVDGLNLIESHVGMVSPALYRLDPERQPTRDGMDRTLAVPLVANQGFGDLLVLRTTGRTLRFALRIGY